MKITAIKTYPLKAARDIFVVKVETDEGIYGLGEAVAVKYSRLEYSAGTDY